MLQAEAKVQLPVLQDDLANTREQLQGQVPLVTFANLAARRAVRTTLQKSEARLGATPELLCCAEPSCLIAWLRVQVAECLVGCSWPLTKLTQELHQLYANASSDSAVTITAIRNHIQDIAARKLLDQEQGVMCGLLHPARKSTTSHADAKLTGAAQTEEPDYTEDDSPGNIYMWDVKKLSSLPKESRKGAGELKAAVKQVHRPTCIYHLTSNHVHESRGDASEQKSELLSLQPPNFAHSGLRPSQWMLVQLVERAELLRKIIPLMRAVAEGRDCSKKLPKFLDRLNGVEQPASKRKSTAHASGDAAAEDDPVSCPELTVAVVHAAMRNAICRSWLLCKAAGTSKAAVNILDYSYSQLSQQMHTACCIEGTSEAHSSPCASSRY